MGEGEGCFSVFFLFLRISKVFSKVFLRISKGFLVFFNGFPRISSFVLGVPRFF